MGDWGDESRDWGLGIGEPARLPCVMPYARYPLTLAAIPYLLSKISELRRRARGGRSRLADEQRQSGQASRPRATHCRPPLQSDGWCAREYG